ncbi:carboxypeptidase-like regulatory domain-containing protein [Gelatiniphilus marinus]|uniref:Carboxypeptidase-like regulatory domain-containing protein n=1 Tax=Gelatiniphilus marinus TaxID=1759464 RepID=A0ABW5JS31_9FLAO
MKTKFSGILTLLLALVVQLSFAQEKTISGTVSDKSGLPLPGTTVLVKGTTLGTSTDFDGNYSIQANSGATLVFSFVGYKAKEVTVGASNVINVTLEEDAESLEEVVITGSASGKSIKELSFALGQVNNELLDNVPAASAGQALQGKISGLSVSPSGGQPGSDVNIQLRTANSIATGQNPLIILDGVILEGGLADINTEDIDRIEVAKGAAGASLYGSRAANGVIQIFSKRGKYSDKVNVRRHLALSGTYRRTSRAAALPALRRENAAEQAAIRHFAK